MQSYDEVRELMEEYQGEAIPEGRWADFCTNFPQGVETYRQRVEAKDDDALSRLAEAWDVFRTVGRRTRREQITIRVDDPRWTALGEILKIRAGRDLDVIGFRTDHLDSGTFEQVDLEPWIREKARHDGSPTTWVRVPLKEDGQTATIKSALSAGKATVESELLEYEVPESAWKRTIPIREGGTLWRLRKVARRLCAQFGWPEAIAVTFILTDVAPERPYTFGYTEHLGEIVPAANWVEMRVNPRAVSPEDLIAAYRIIRSRAIGGGDRERRIRRLEEKAARLAVFWEETEGMALPERMVEWNRQYPKWKYLQPGTNFGRDGSTAHRNVIGEEQRPRFPDSDT